MPQPKSLRVLTAFYKTNREFKHFLKEKMVLSIRVAVLRGVCLETYFISPEKNNCISWAAPHNALEHLCLVILPGGVGINIDLELLLPGSKSCHRKSVSFSPFLSKKWPLWLLENAGPLSCLLRLFWCAPKSRCFFCEGPSLRAATSPCPQLRQQLWKHSSVCTILDLVTSWEK